MYIYVNMENRLYKRLFLLTKKYILKKYIVIVINIFIIMTKKKKYAQSVSLIKKARNRNAGFKVILLAASCGWTDIVIEPVGWLND